MANRFSFAEVPSFFRRDRDRKFDLVTAEQEQKNPEVITLENLPRRWEELPLLDEVLKTGAKSISSFKEADSFEERVLPHYLALAMEDLGWAGTALQQIGRSSCAGRLKEFKERLGWDDIAHNEKFHRSYTPDRVIVSLVRAEFGDTVCKAVVMRAYDLLDSDYPMAWWRGGTFENLRLPKKEEPYFGGDCCLSLESAVLLALDRKHPTVFGIQISDLTEFAKSDPQFVFGGVDPSWVGTERWFGCPHEQKYNLNIRDIKRISAFRVPRGISKEDLMSQPPGSIRQEVKDFSNLLEKIEQRSYHFEDAQFDPAKDFG